MLRFFFTTIFIWVVSTHASAHEFYFAFAELNYNELNQRFEGTLIFTTHDLERAIEPKGTLIGRFEKLDETSAELKLIENYLNAHFRISYGCALDSNAVDAYCQANFVLDGIVTQLNGTIECYISAPARAIYSPINIQFDALMERYNQQQNKCTFTYRNQKETFNFLPYDNQKYFIIKPWKNCLLPF